MMKQTKNRTKLTLPIGQFRNCFLWTPSLIMTQCGCNRQSASFPSCPTIFAIMYTLSKLSNNMVKFATHTHPERHHATFWRTVLIAGGGHDKMRLFATKYTGPTLTSRWSKMYHSLPLQCIVGQMVGNNCCQWLKKNHWDEETWPDHHEVWYCYVRRPLSLRVIM